MCLRRPIGLSQTNSHRAERPTVSWLLPTLLAELTEGHHDIERVHRAVLVSAISSEPYDCGCRFHLCGMPRASSHVRLLVYLCFNEEQMGRRLLPRTRHLPIPRNACPHPDTRACHHSSTTPSAPPLRAFPCCASTRQRVVATWTVSLPRMAGRIHTPPHRPSVAPSRHRHQRQSTKPHCPVELPFRAIAKHRATRPSSNGATLEYAAAPTHIVTKPRTYARWPASTTCRLCSSARISIDTTAPVLVTSLRVDHH